ncbi:hypothetical protein NDN08_001875 [Rhodosorus marinus]|uniref:AMP-activated protein kinase glycogen-binding domain-containing protein n=1 Tax=Rhodosorus marinus TaxID=101924 RepID=A0AAV8UUX6_9RHOD|nr:hypothetical protein NDN08_001875 [Rhodosorus marinus]
MERLKIRDSVAAQVDDLGDFASVSSNRHFSVREEVSIENSRELGDKVLTAFVWKDEAKAVAVAMSRDRFKPHPLVKTREGHFACVMELSPGEFTFRFLVDGQWRVNEEDPSTIVDKRGERFHHLVVSSELAEASLNREVLNREVLNALTKHKEALPRSQIPAVNVKYTQNKSKEGFLRRPLGIIGVGNPTTKINVAENPPTRPEKPPVLENRLSKYAQAEENAHQRQELARAMVKRGADDGALALFKVALTIREENGLALTPANAHCHAEMAMVFMKVGEIELAETHLRLALRIWREAPKGNFANEPKHRFGDMCHYLAVVLDRGKKHDEASKLYRITLKVYTEHSDGVEERKFVSLKKNMMNNNKKRGKHQARAPGASSAPRNY